VPYYVVVGGDEIEGDTVGVNVRADDVELDMTLAELEETVREDIGDLPQRPRYLPRRVSNHPTFTGG
jgi:threonyl-tRNA synthetase